MKTLMLSLVLLSFCSQSVYAVAYCSLRDPIAQITQLFPNKSNQLSIVKNVDVDIRAQVKAALPNNDLHFNELGKHTLYVAMQNGQALGYVHVRSELSDWGLVEIVWAIDMNMRIKDFVFQRCRSPEKAHVDNDNFKKMFIGKNYQDLKRLLKSDGVSANETLIKQAPKAPALANVVLRCALKTLLITDLLWQKELDRFY